ncbi:hypothetical protein CDEST_10240 [Colletotrichum destructivum]|uniref:Secreted protein n=1 Tax=Colletotrichum destructivum TaxID=34406 RepID=A0AAX4IQF3_9PEZI|nr:hypothetical protein CDEST_10240 [Colletotrichum destructivum]
MRSLIFLSLAAFSAAAAVDTSVAPLPIGEVGWEGVVVPGQPPIQVWGDSFEDIEAKIRVDHPDFSIYTEEVQEEPESSGNPSEEVVSLLANVNKDVSKYNCNRGGWVYDFTAWDAIEKVKKIAGNKCMTRARKCVRLSCVSGTAVGVCNDNTHDIHMPCSMVGRMADTIYRNCWKQDTICGPPGAGCIGTMPLTQGQAFSPGGTWNTIIGVCSFFGNGERPVKA